MTSPLPTGIYRHYRGGFYQVLGIAAHTETGEDHVVYVSLDATLPGPRLRVRPLLGPSGFAVPIIAGFGTRERFVYMGHEIPAQYLPGGSKYESGYTNNKNA